MKDSLANMTIITHSCLGAETLRLCLPVFHVVWAPPLVCLLSGVQRTAGFGMAGWRPRSGVQSAAGFGMEGWRLRSEPWSDPPPGVSWVSPCMSRWLVVLRRFMPDFWGSSRGFHDGCCQFIPGSQLSCCSVGVAILQTVQWCSCGRRLASLHPLPCRYPANLRGLLPQLIKPLWFSRMTYCYKQFLLS